MKKDILEKGAIVQRDRETFAIAPPIPAGLTTPAQLREIAEVAEKYGAAALKLTSAQRIAIIGIEEDDLDAIWEDLSLVPSGVIGPCVRSVKICPGTTYCKRGQQDSIKVGLELNERYHGTPLPYKFKMGVSGCVNDCSEVCIKDIGLIGTPKGWKVAVGGAGGSKPHIAEIIATELDDEAAAALVDDIFNWYLKKDEKKRLWKLIEEMGLEKFKEELLP
ncbi:MAG: NAD(P)/FAD-dependent oxidoreductase [Deltaproteobacteria bacterium]|nr:MAG: NAD(P)/FAD-dependent oxidoreductase [Deltaproteobacteria bacterium]